MATGVQVQSQRAAIQLGFLSYQATKESGTPGESIVDLVGQKTWITALRNPLSVLVQSDLIWSGLVWSSLVSVHLSKQKWSNQVLDICLKT